jgi:hypothetical protein
MNIITFPQPTGSGGGGSMTAAEIAVAYESNPNRNAYTDDEKATLFTFMNQQLNNQRFTQTDVDALRTAWLGYRSIIQDIAITA